MTPHDLRTTPRLFVRPEDEPDEGGRVFPARDLGTLYWYTRPLMMTNAPQFEEKPMERIQRYLDGAEHDPHTLATAGHEPDERLPLPVRLAAIVGLAILAWSLLLVALLAIETVLSALRGVFS